MIVSPPFFVWGGREGAMTIRWPFNRRETFQLVGWLVILVAAIPRWVDLFEKWGVDAAGLVPYLEPLQEARWGIAASGVLWLLWILQSRFRAALARWEWARERYVRALVWLSGPVSDELLATMLDDADADKAQFDAQLHQRVTRLSLPAVQALRGLLRMYRPAGSRQFRIGPRSDDERRDQKLAGYALACEELKDEGFLSKCQMGTDDEAVTVTLAPWVRGGLVLRLFDWLNDELDARG